MGVLSDTLRRVRRLYLILLLISLVNLSVCIYEDQIGKFDWRQTYVGKIKFARLDSAARRIIVATEENVLAALNLKTGQIVWRHVLEHAGAGNIQFLHVSDAAITVTGDNPYMVRGWDTATGLLLWEWSLVLNAKSAELSEWLVHQGQLLHVLPEPGSHVEVTSYSARTGHNRGQTARIVAPWVNEGCIVSAPRLICTSGEFGKKSLFSVDLASPDMPVLTKSLSSHPNWATSEGILDELDGDPHLPGFILDNKVGVFDNNNVKVLDVKLNEGSSVTIIDSAEGPVVLQAYEKNEKLHVAGAPVQAAAPVQTWSVSARVPGAVLEAAVCARGSCRLLISGDDHSLTLRDKQGQVLWNREESLARVAAVEFVDLPVSELEAAIESEFTRKTGDIWGAFVRRIQSQAQQLATVLQTLVRRATNREGDGDAVETVRDELDLHKLIVLVTKPGKIFGIDNLSGAILWSAVVPGLSASRVSVFTRRSARHPPHPALLTIVGSHETTGNGLLVNLDPITGALYPEGVVSLDYRLKQVAMLPGADAEHSHPLVLLAPDNSVQVMPVSGSGLVRNFYMFVAEMETTKVEGFALNYNGKEVTAEKTWSLVLGGTEDSGQRIVRVAGKPPHERVHSHGKVMGDRSVLYKYINPNLILFLTEGPDPVHKDVVHMFLVDGVCGAVVASQSHKRARATPHAVHAENLVAYAYHNDKQRRTEIATLELYEGYERSRPAGAAFSSHAPPAVPHVARQAYVLPAHPTAMAHTVTERGITDKHVLVALSTGMLVEMPWAYLDPRRPPAPEQREEGLLQYAPELPLPAEFALNYNRTVRARAVHAATSGLESTCLVLATGLDLFYTRVAPSKTFDLLKDDFDYHLITLVLGALIVATLATKHFADRKMLRQAWK